MANLSDAFGTIKVEQVAKEFIEFINAVQGDDSDAYYKLIEMENLKNAKVDGDNLTLDFGIFGRWNYSSNIRGYLGGEWMLDKDYNGKEINCRKAYEKFIEAVKAKNGVVTVEYTDGDPAMDWMGTGTAVLSVVDGEVDLSEDFDEEDITLKRYAELYGYDNEIDAMESLWGDEPMSAYCDYLEKWEEEHKGPEFKGMKPAGPEEWYENEFEWE